MKIKPFFLSSLFLALVIADAYCQVNLDHPSLTRDTPEFKMEFLGKKAVTNAHRAIAQRSSVYTINSYFNKELQKPFFCRIEDAIATKNKVNFKFRLGSVQYVDAMEGKGFFEALSYSRTTNYIISRKRR